MIARNELRKQGGFTLIELMLSMTFISFIMVFVVVVLIQTMSVYNKGLALRQINQTGRQVGEDITHAMRYTSLKSMTNLADSNWRLCIGGVSYVWNQGEDVSQFKNKYDGSNRQLRMVRVTDPGQAMCKATAPGVYPNVPNDNSRVTNLVGSQVIVQTMSVNSHDGSGEGGLTPGLIDVTMVLSTMGENQPFYIDGQWQCFERNRDGSPGKPNDFCAFGEFDNTVYVRGF